MSTPRGAALRRRARDRTLSFARGHAYRSGVRALVACARSSSAADEDYATAAPPSSLVTPRFRARPRGTRLRPRPGARRAAAAATAPPRFEARPERAAGFSGGRPFCCPTAASTYGAATCYRADDVFRCRRENAPSAGGEVRRVSPWYALFSSSSPLPASRCAATRASAARPSHRHPRRTTPPRPSRDPTTPRPVATRFRSGSKDTAPRTSAGAGASAYSAPPPPLNPPRYHPRPTYPPTYPSATPNPYATPPPPSAVHDMSRHRSTTPLPDAGGAGLLGGLMLGSMLGGGGGGDGGGGVFRR